VYCQSIFFFFYLAQGKSINDIYKIMVKTLYAIRQMMFDLDLKVKIVKEKKQPVIPYKNRFFFLRIDVEIMNGLAQMIFLGG